MKFLISIVLGFYLATIGLFVPIATFVGIFVLHDAGNWPGVLFVVVLLFIMVVLLVYSIYEAIANLSASSHGGESLKQEDL